MEFNWTTFFLEIINFLVLLWILQRLLYQPIKKIILARKAEIQKAVDDANQTKKTAMELQTKYENRLKEWEKERAEKLVNLQHEMQEEKKRQLLALENLLKTEKEKAAAQEEQRVANLIAKKEKSVITNAIKFSARFLKSFADAELESKLLVFLLQALDNLPPGKIAALKKEINNHQITVQIQSVFQLADEQKKQLISTIEKTFADKNLIYNFTLNPELLAGFLISIGSVVFDANIKHELQLFAEVQMHD